jgi:hypothetical protein
MIIEEIVESLKAIPALGGNASDSLQPGQVVRAVWKNGVAARGLQLHLVANFCEEAGLAL